MYNRVLNNPKITIKTNCNIKQWNGDNDILSSVDIVNSVSGEEENILCDGAFIAIGHVPNTKVCVCVCVW